MSNICLKELINELQYQLDNNSLYYKYGCQDFTYDELLSVINYLNDLKKTKEQLRKARKEAKRFKRKYLILKYKIKKENQENGK